MDLDWITYLLQFSIFLVCLVVVNGLLLRPFLRVILEREKKIEGAQAQSEELQRLGDVDMQAYQVQMREAKSKAQREREKYKNEGREKERKLLASVRAEIADKLNQARAEVDEAEREARRNLSADTEAMARRLVEKVLGRKVTT